MKPRKQPSKVQQLAIGTAVALVEVVVGIWAKLWIVIAIGVATMAYALILAALPKRNRQ